MKLFDSTNIPLLSKALDAYALRQKVTAANIANITTPGYKSQHVSFEEQLAAASDQAIRGATTDERHMPVGQAQDMQTVRPEVRETARDRTDGETELASGFNDVNIDVEMTELAKNQIRFKFGSRLLGNTFRGIQQAIRGTV